jgi:hypothetical protein
MFRGVQKDASALGNGLSDILNKFFEYVVPDLYPMLQMGSRLLKGDEAEHILKTPDLKALPNIFCLNEQGLGLVVEEGQKSVVNKNAAIAMEVLDYLKSERSHGNRDNRMGKTLERRFGGTPYGWEPDILRLILAALFRAGEIEVTYRGSRFHNYHDPASSIPFTSNPAFRASLFSPRQSVGLKTLTYAVQLLEDLTGEEVDVEEGTIATAFKKVAAEELEKLYPLKATAEAHHLPIFPMLSEYQQTLTGIQASDSDDCVRILTENGKEFGEIRDKVSTLRESLNDEAIGVLRQAREATDHVWQRLAPHNSSAELETTVARLRELLGSESILDYWDEIAANTKKVREAYRNVYCELFDRRKWAYESAIGEIKNRSEWEPLEASNPGMASSLLSPLQARVGDDEDKEAVMDGPSLGRASPAEMESDLAAVDALKSAVLVKLQELSIGGEKNAPVRKVRASEYFNRPIQTQAELDKVLERIRDSLQKYIDGGAIIILE